MQGKITSKRKSKVEINFHSFQLKTYNSTISKGFPECEDLDKISEHLDFWFMLVGGSLDNVIR